MPASPIRGGRCQIPPGVQAVGALVTVRAPGSGGSWLCCLSPGTLPQPSASVSPLVEWGYGTRYLTEGYCEDW